MTRDAVVARAKALGFKYVYIPGEGPTSGALPLDKWQPRRTASYDNFKILGDEIIVDETRQTFGGAWPLLVRSSEAPSA